MALSIAPAATSAQVAAFDGGVFVPPAPPPPPTVSSGAALADAGVAESLEADAAVEPVPLDAPVTDEESLSADTEQTGPEPPSALGTVVVTGVRGGAARTIADSPSPIDVIGSREVQQSGRTGLKEILGAVVPAMSMPALGGGGTSASVRPYTYRGLSGDYLLVLINGKRRHTTALINNLSRLSGGSTPVDLDLIPAAAISKIEILRDGAAAQYGSDAISGVLNVILDESEGFSANTTAGQHYEKHGAMVQQTASYGVKLGDRGGFLRLSAEARFRDRADSSASPLPDKLANGQPNYYYPPFAVDQPDPREASRDDTVFAGGYGRSNRDVVVNTGYNFELPLGKVDLYSFTTFSYRNIKDARGAFSANRVESLPEIYPEGFQAYRRIWEYDGQAALGLKQQDAWLRWDLSTSYGRDYVKLGAENTLNPSLGPTSPTTFFMGKQLQDLWVSNLDLGHDFDIGLAEPLAVSLGFEHRWERFQNRAGEPDSYRDGNYVIPVLADPFHQRPLPGGVGGFGGLAPSPGLASFSGTSTVDARSLDRNNIAAYAELSTSFTKAWYLGIAGRFEHYDDSAGDVASGKIATRVKVVDGLALRGGFNTGFRAPSLAQTGFSTTQVTGTVINAERVRTTSKFLPVDSVAAQALGAEPLKPEKSISATAGITVEPEKDIRFTLDIFQTSIDDRIVKTDFLGTAANGGTAVADLLERNGVSDVDSAQFFANAIDTTTRGLDLVGEWTLRTGALGTVRPTVAYTFAKTKIDRVAGNPTELSTLNVTRFGRQGQIDLVRGAPLQKLVLSANWQVWRLRSDLRVTRYGEYVEASNTAVGDRKFDPRWIADLDVGVDLTDNLALAVGAYNLFDTYPKKVGLVNAQDGSGQYGNFAPFGFSGGFYYARLAVNL
ncbi:MAG: TonB-dependent receptor [Polyangiales bacterium]